MNRRYASFLRMLLVSVLAVFSCREPEPARAQVLTGLDNLIAQNWAPLKGQHVGLITNQTGRTKNGEFGPHLFATQHVFTLAALYSPEHGLLGQRQAGVASDSQETFEGVPVYSLYGSARKPTPAMLRGITALVFDIQDVGVRPYTYLSTLTLAMEAAAENGIPFYVLDRPNPLSGERVEGNLLDPSLKSFVGQVPVPYLHGMTLGELATMGKAKGWFDKASSLALTVIPMTGWRRSMYWPATGLTWTAPSPNVPGFPNAVGLAMLGATGELGVLSIGVGTDAPFLRVGSNLVKGQRLVQYVRGAFPASIGITAEDFSATTSVGTKTYSGAKLTLPSDLSTVPSLYEPQYRMLASMMQDTLFRNAVAALPASTNTMYQKVTGTYSLIDKLKVCGDLSPIFTTWRKDAAAFRKARAPFLIYK